MPLQNLAMCQLRLSWYSIRCLLLCLIACGIFSVDELQHLSVLTLKKPQA